MLIESITSLFEGKSIYTSIINIILCLINKDFGSNNNIYVYFSLFKNCECHVLL